MKTLLRVLGLGIALFVCGSAIAQQSAPATGAGITRLVITKRQIAFGGASFGTAGPYEVLAGTAYGELDPHAPGNSGIVNVSRAPVNASGHVEYSVDFMILKPADPKKGNGRLIYDFVNRGRNTILRLDESGDSFTASDAGNGFLMSHGYTVAWSGWQMDAPANPGFLRAYVPVAREKGKPVTGMSREEFTDVPAGPVFTQALDYPALLDTTGTTLTVREHETDARKPLPATSWHFIDERHVEITAEPGFDRGALYELIYPATNESIADVGLAASRDFVSFLRYADQDTTGQPNPARDPGTPFKAALSFGISQTGRAINDFIYQGFNADNNGRMVFDGALPLLSSTRRTFTNFDFAQPGRFGRQHEDHEYSGDQFPFTYATSKDPITGKTDGFLMQCEKSHTCPKIVHLDSDTEFWQNRDSLLVTDAAGKPLTLPENVRAYMISGQEHNPAPNWNTRGTCAQLQNAMNYAPYARALLVALDRWVTEGVAPPPTTFPNLKNHTLLPLAKVQASYPAIPGAPFSPLYNKLEVLDTESMPPKASGREYPLFFPPVDADGNPQGGIIPPEIAVPIATYSGRNVRAESFSPGELCGLAGSYIPFTATKQERMANGDPRPSLEERYKNAQDYTEKRRHAVDALVQQGFILPEDAEALARSMPLPGTVQGKL
ncbi:MAG TPA: alpha/beta hydrolase domain-containing protein [Verrucomicrobiae bacterium]|nr:alpha/beta hydrolase domain-containing protein [Verrucomicrobiae bacterium]